MLTYVSGLFLIFAGLLIGYFLSLRERGEDETSRIRLGKENADLKQSLKRGQMTLVELEEKYSRQNGQLHVLQQLCDDWSASREEAEHDRTKLEVLLNEHQNKNKEIIVQLQDQSERRMQLEEQLHSTQKSQIEQLNLAEAGWVQQFASAESLLAQRQTDLKHLDGEKERLAERLHTAEARIADLMSDLASQRTLYETASNNAHGLKEEHTSLESSLSMVNDRMRDAESNCARAISARDLAEESLASTREQVEQQHSEIIELKGQVAGMRSLQQQLSAGEASLAGSDERLKIVMSERDQAIGAEKSAHGHIVGLQKQIENQESTIQSLRKNKEEALEKMRDTIEERSQLEQDFETTASSLRDELDVRFVRIQAVESERDELLAQITSERDELSRQLADETNQRSHFEASWQQTLESLEEYRSECDRLQLSMHEQTEERTQFALSWQETSKELDEFKRRCAELETSLTSEAELQREIGSLRVQLDTETNRRSDLESRKDELESSLRILKSRCDEMMNELSELQSIRDQHAVANDKWKEYRIRLEQTLGQRDSSLSELNTYRHEISQLHDQLGSANDTIRELRDRLTHLEGKQKESEQMVLSLSEARRTVDHEYGGQTRVDSVRGRVFTERPDVVDDLKLISGVAEVLEEKLNDYGVYTFRQIMEWDETNIVEFQALLATFKDRISRDDWVGQAAHLYEHFPGAAASQRAA